MFTSFEEDDRLETVGTALTNLGELSISPPCDALDAVVFSTPQASSP